MQFNGPDKIKWKIKVGAIKYNLKVQTKRKLEKMGYH